MKFIAKLEYATFEFETEDGKLYRTTEEGNSWERLYGESWESVHLEEEVECKIAFLNYIARNRYYESEQEKISGMPRCSVCGTTENVRYMGGHQPYLCDSDDCIPY